MSASPFHGIFSAFSQAQEEQSPRKTKVAVPTESVPVLEREEPAPAEAGRLAVDIYEQDDYYIIRAALAGVRMSDLDIEVEGNVITIRGVRKQPEAIPESQYYLQECYWGEFSRSVTLPCQIDAKKVRATFNKDCILKVLVPHEERVKVVRISEA